MGEKRGAAINPANPFERFHVEEDPAAVEELRRIDPEWQPAAPETAFYVDDTQTLITRNESPDLSFEASLNPYRGCEHGCSCFAILRVLYRREDDIIPGLGSGRYRR